MTGRGSVVQRLRQLVEGVAMWRVSPDERPVDARFEAEAQEQSRRGIRIFCLFALALLVASAADSYVAEPDRFLVLLGIRLISAAALVGIIALLSTDLGAHRPRAVALAFVLVMSLTIHALALESGGPASPQYDRLNLVMLGLVVFVAWSATWAALACGLVIGVYLVGTGLSAGAEGNPYLVAHLGRMLATAVVTVGGTAVRTHARRRSFLDRRALSEARAQHYESEQRYRLLVETAGSAIIVLTPDGRILEFNREAELFYGRPRHAVLGQDYAELFVPEPQHADLRRLRQRVLAGEVVRTLELPVRSQHGERRVVAWNVTRLCAGGDEPLGVIAVGHDITERKRAEEEVQRLNSELEQRVQMRTAELRVSEERFRTIFESAPIGILTADRGGRIRHANRALQAMLGYRLDELQDRSVGDLTVADDRQRCHNAFRQLCERRVPELLMDKRYVRRDGATVWVHEAFAAVCDDGGEFAYALAMVEDVTERQRAEERAREHQEQLAHVLRVSTMGEMAAELAHELNQPLGAIVNFANGTLVRLRARGIEPEIERAVTQIAAEGMRAGEIIRGIREFVRQGAARREPADVNHLVRHAAHLLEAEARGHGIPLRLALDAALPAVEVDRIQVEQVVLNLLRNAIDAIIGARRGDDEVLVRTYRNGAGAIEVAVRDTGVGLPAENAARIFDAFFTTKHGGLGMGLSISRSIVEAHGGRLWAADNRDRGMTFTFSLPLVDRRRVAAA
jgi:PAS domain S-box-containing protein